MIIDLMAWAPTREDFLAGMLANHLMVYLGDGVIVPAEDVLVDELGPILKVFPTYDEEGIELTPAEVVEGHHVNLRAFGRFAEDVTNGLAQTDAEGNLLSVFDRTWMLEMVPGLAWAPTLGVGVPAGYEGPHGVRLFDPSVVATPARVWA